MTPDRLEAHLTPIRSGVTPAPEGAGKLTRDRAQWLEEQLRGLRAARARAGVAARTYVVGAGEAATNG